MTDRTKIIYLCHDIERALGHLDSKPEFSELVNRSASAYLEEMLKTERKLGVRATYNVVGCLLRQVKADITRDGHCVAFHSYDHALNRRQLARCRQLDPSIIGYRAPRSIITEELNDDALRHHGFKWLASSAKSLGTKLPKKGNGIIKIPILFDDFELFSRGTVYHEWEAKAVASIANGPIAAFCLHDCYAFYWLPHYQRFLERILRLGTLSVLDNVGKDYKLE
jgi:peptidoglycan/xylan/chitin deacetylase (PgdA/CDA1 family)